MGEREGREGGSPKRGRRLSTWYQHTSFQHVNIRSAVNLLLLETRDPQAAMSARALCHGVSA
eukprot:1790624-Rhodomonas_salina.1